MLGALVRVVRWGPFYQRRPSCSQVLRTYLRQRHLPAWTSFFVRYSAVQDELFGQSHFNFDVDGCNYHVLRTGCLPFIKLHCTRRPPQDLSTDDRLYRFLKVVNLGLTSCSCDCKANHHSGLPCLVYGVVAICLIRHVETAVTERGPVKLYFLIEETHDRGHV